MQLSGLDAVGALSLFEPQPSDPSRLNHTIGLGATAPLALQCTLTLTLGGAPHAFNLSLSLANATLRLATRTPIDGSALGALSLAALGQQPACAAQPLENASLVAGSSLAIAPPPHGALAVAATPLDPAAGASDLPPELLRALLRNLTPGLLDILNDALGLSS